MAGEHRRDTLSGSSQNCRQHASVALLTQFATLSRWPRAVSKHGGGLCGACAPACARCIRQHACRCPVLLLCASVPLTPRPLAQPFHLAAELRGHGEDVRAVAVAGPHGVATTSRDKTLRTWPVEGGAQLRGESTVFVGHTDFVGPVVWAPPGLLPVAPQGALVTGSRDTTVLVWHPNAAVTLQRLAGHSLQVGTGHRHGLQALRAALRCSVPLVSPPGTVRSSVALTRASRCSRTPGLRPLHHSRRRRGQR